MYGKGKSKELYASGKASKRRQMQLASQAAREKSDMQLGAFGRNRSHSTLWNKIQR